MALRRTSHITVLLIVADLTISPHTWCDVGMKAMLGCDTCKAERFAPADALDDIAPVGIVSFS